jgi:fibronectin type 3 domain-containing protein
MMKILPALVAVAVFSGCGGGAPTVASNVVAAPTGAATLTWEAPTLNTDGTALSNLSGFNIYYGTSPTSLTQKESIASPSTTSYTLSNLTSGAWYFGVTAYDSAGYESALSNTGAVVIP